MHELVIVISDLFLSSGETNSARNGGAWDTFPGFEHLLRFGRSRVIDGGWRPWMARWMGRDDLAAAVPANVAAAAADTTADTSVQPLLSPDVFSVWFATPIHLIAGLTRLHLDRRSLLRLPPEDLASFAEGFQRTFGDFEFILKPTSSGEFLMLGPRGLAALTSEPARALVNDLEASLPAGLGAPALKRLGAELEMWLHSHPLNDARRQRGELPVSTLWLWGGGPLGPLTQSKEPPVRYVFGSDPYLAGLWRLCNGDQRGAPQPVPGHFVDLFDGARLALGCGAHDEHEHYARHQIDSGAGSARVALVAELASSLHINPRWTFSEGLADLDRRFVSPALEALAQGALDAVVLIANDRELRVRPGDRLKFWRRRRSGLAGLQGQ